MDLLELIEAKRDGQPHDEEALRWLVDQVVEETVPDYQLAAWLMAVVCRGMTDDETAALTMAMAESGHTMDLSDLPGPVVDKHSTGGVGDKTSLVVGPLAAATGLTVAKMSGRGLGHTGGTLDKLESIPGFSVDRSPDEFKAQATDVRLVIAGQTGDLAPADKHLYALRDVTGTVPSLPLIASSIMSKKIAAGASGIALDVKFGSGAFMPSLDDARELARTMVRLGEQADRRMAAALTAMDRPLGRAVGNALEVAEAIRTLKGDGPPRFTSLCLDIAGLMHVVAGRATRPDDVRERLQGAIDDGRALERLARMIDAQGGDAATVDDPGRLPTAPIRWPVPAPRDGFLAHIDARTVGRVCLHLGAGRTEKGQPVDPAVGVVMKRDVGDEVFAGDAIAEIHARSNDSAKGAVTRMLTGVSVDDERPDTGEVVHEIVMEHAG